MQEALIKIAAGIQSYLKNQDFTNFINTSNDPRFQQIKYLSKEWNLTSHFTKQFLSKTKPTFRKELLQKMSDPSKQLKINLGDMEASKLFPTIQPVFEDCPVIAVIEINNLTNDKQQGGEKTSAILHELSFHVHTLILYSVPDDLTVSGEGSSSSSSSSSLSLSLAALPIALSRLTISYAMRISNLSSFHALQSLEITYCSITNTMGLENIPNLSLESCDQLIDISNLGKQSSLFLRRCPLITEVNHLSSVKYLTLRECPLIHDISQLGNCYSLIIDECRAFLTLPDPLNLTIFRLRRGNPKMQNFHILQGALRLKKLSLIYCSFVDTTIFAHVPSVEISWCSNVSDVSSLSSLTHLQLKNCRNIGTSLNFSVLFNHLYFLSIYEIENLEDVSCCGNIPIVKINRCQKIASLASFGQPKQKEVEIEIWKALDYSSLQNISSIKIHSSEFKNGYQIQFVQFITLVNCGITDVSMFHLAKRVNLTLCSEIETLQGLRNVPEIVIERCEKLHDISGLGRNISVKLIDCAMIISIENLAEVRDVSIIRCHQVRDVTALASVGTVLLQIKKASKIKGMKQLPHAKIMFSEW